MGGASRDLESRLLELQHQLEEERRRCTSATRLAEDSTKETSTTQAMVGSPLNEPCCVAPLHMEPAPFFFHTFTDVPTSSSGEGAFLPGRIPAG